MSIESMIPSNHLILCHPLLLPSIFQAPFNLQGLFQWVGYSHRWPKALELQPLASVLPMNIQDWFPLVLTGLISLQSNGLSRVVSSTTIHYNITYTDIFLCYFYLQLSWNYCDNKTININFRTYMSGTLVITLHVISFSYLIACSIVIGV